MFTAALVQRGGGGACNVFKRSFASLYMALTRL